MNYKKMFGYLIEQAFKSGISGFTYRYISARVG